MGAINITIGALAGAHEVDDQRLTNVLRLYGQATVQGFADMTNQEKAAVVAQELYQHARKIAWQERQSELRKARAAEDQAEYDQL